MSEQKEKRKFDDVEFESDGETCLESAKMLSVEIGRFKSAKYEIPVSSDQATEKAEAVCETRAR